MTLKKCSVDRMVLYAAHASSPGYVRKLCSAWLSSLSKPSAGRHRCSSSEASLALPLEEAEAAAVQENLEVQPQEACDALAHQEADTEASHSETRILARQLEVRPGWSPGISSFPF